MISKIRRKTSDLKLKYKLVLIYCFTGFIPVFIIFLVSLYLMRGVLRENSTENINSYLYQATASLDGEIKIYDNLSSYISFNQSISQVLNYDYESVYNMYDQFVTVMDPLLSSLMYFHDEVNRVTIYIDKDVVKHGTTLAPMSEISDKEWCKEALSDNDNHWYVDMDKKQVFSVSRLVLLNRLGIDGVLFINVDYDKAFEAFSQTILNDYGLFITDKNGNLIYELSQYDQSNKDYALTFDEFKEVVADHSDKYKIITQDSAATGWKIWFYKPDSFMISSIIWIGTISIIVCVAAAVVCTTATSRFVTRRIVKIQKCMKEVENGNLNVNVPVDGNDEISDLTRGFDAMVLRLDMLINEVYDSRLKEKEYEMKALQAQINPHFLYNTLSLINWKAIEADAVDISKITLALSSFYRTSLNKGKNVMSIKDEIDNMRSYLTIQQMMHDGDFDAVIDIEDGILQYNTLNLILQPLIENAIDHGIDLNTGVRGVITITGRGTEDEIILTVEDNGVGMTKEQADKIITKDSKGYGVRNVNERIKLYYGEQYELKIESEIGKGTKVIVHFPKML